ncbi:unnamed protein product [Cercopithifilaria johnstoni]|uniref:Uncharacterized protein n=1 Tax=Cercopithifilaria johnstoni TaxID=2874296 RepID=A0A8J2Q884_9BILA|nr:unnamed protein product [Cercopithifilaria johnstoni]
MDFNVTVNYGSNNHGNSINVEHLLRACSNLKNNDELYGITYDDERFPIIFNNSLNNLDGKILRNVDVIFYCIKNEWKVTNDSALAPLSALFYHKLSSQYRQMIATKRSTNINNIHEECISQSLVGDSCVAIIEGRVGFIPHFKVGLFRMYDMAQFEASDIVKNYLPEQDYQSFPIDYLALGNKRYCRSRSTKQVESDSNRFFDFSECTVLATPDFYYQLCCCDESLEICSSLENDLRVDPGKPIIFLNDSLDESHKLAEYGLDENSVRRKYENELDERSKKKPQIVCAIGTLEMNKTLREKRLINDAFPINVHSCRSVYRYRRKIMEMDSASGCTMARKNKNGYHYCQIRNLICPAQESIPEKMTVDCCCEGNHLCNHDMNSYRAFYSLPMYINNPLCAHLSEFRFVFLSGDEKYCAVHYDFVLGKVVNLHVNVNMDLPREDDHNAYKKLGCQFIEAKIRVNIPVRCKDEIYKRDDTLMGRLIYVCTCPGKALSERMNKSACDVKLEKRIARKAMADAEKSKLPSCYHINLIMDAINSAPIGIANFLLNNITKPSGNH